jgi:hypothetical protein
VSCDLVRDFESHSDADDEDQRDGELAEKPFGERIVMTKSARAEHPHRERDADDERRFVPPRTVSGGHGRSVDDERQIGGEVQL